MSIKSGIVVARPTIQYKSVLHQAGSFDPFFQVKAVDDDKGIIRAYASKFGNEDTYGDIVVPGAYKRTLTNQRQAKRPYLYTYLFQHEPNLIVGGICDAEEDKDGLPYEAQCNLETQIGRECYSNAKMGVLYQSSIGYDIPSGGFEYKDGIRYLKEIRLWEISLVVFAANAEATVTDVKAVERVPELHTKKNVGGKQQPTIPQVKTFQEHFSEESCEDLLEDWQDVYLSALTDSVLDAFKIGDTAETDISDAIDAFKEQVMSTFVALGIEHGLSAYLTANSYSSADSTMQNGSGGYYGMASQHRITHKAGRAVSAANADKIQGHVDTMRAVATKMKAHTSDLNTAADDLATMLQGAEAAYGTDPGTPDTPEGKAASLDQARGAHTHPSEEDTVNEQELTATLDSLRALHVC